MNLLLRRNVFTDTSTIGRLYVDNVPTCYTLEDRDRRMELDLSVKVPAKTAIPRRRYRVDVTFSNRFQKMLPLLLNVPAFEGVRIHPGNTDKDTEGCILVGVTRSENFIGGSRVAFDQLLPMIQKALGDGEEVWIDVT